MDRADAGQPRSYENRGMAGRGYGNQLSMKTIKKLDQSSFGEIPWKAGPAQLAERMNQADVFVLPSFTRVCLL